MKAYETGAQNAQRFVEMVDKLSRDGRVVLVYAAAKNEAQWPWMRNPAWQNCVIDRLEEQGVQVRSAEFHSSDNVDGLCFTAISTAGDSNVERLDINKTIDGEPAPEGFLGHMRWVASIFMPRAAV